MWPAAAGDMSIQGVSSLACFKDPSATVLPTPVAYPNGMQIHNAWHISWNSSDIKFLSPTPPALDCSQYIPTWVPGQSVAETSCSNPDDTSLYPAPVLWFLAVGIPLITVALIAACCTLCFRHRRKERKARESRAART